MDRTHTPGADRTSQTEVVATDGLGRRGLSQAQGRAPTSPLPGRAKISRGLLTMERGVQMVEDVCEQSLVVPRSVSKSLRWKYACEARAASPKLDSSGPSGRAIARLGRASRKRFNELRVVDRPVDLSSVPRKAVGPPPSLLREPLLSDSRGLGRLVDHQTGL